jgi:excisionase family DNA binding protein
MQDRWLTSEEVAERFRLPVKTLYSWRQTGYGPQGVRIGRHVRYRESEVTRWEAETEQTTRPRSDA